jgi:hypothetical protein
LLDAGQLIQEINSIFGNTFSGLTNKGPQDGITANDEAAAEPGTADQIFHPDISFPSSQIRSITTTSAYAIFQGTDKKRSNQNQNTCSTLDAAATTTTPTSTKAGANYDVEARERCAQIARIRGHFATLQGT